jgi:hypothetical protein
MADFKVRRGLKDWNTVRPRVQDNYEAALENLNASRTGHRPLREVVKEDGRISLATQLRYTRQATTRDVFGRVVAKPADRLFRPMEILDARGERQLRAIYGSRSASDIGRHQAALSRFLETGDESVLAPLRAVRRGGVELASDHAVIEQAAREGTLDDLSPYPKGTRL